MTDQIVKIISEKFKDKFNKNEILTISKQIKRLLDLQHLDIINIKYIGEGQSYITFGIGDYVLKIGQETKMVKNPFQLLPIHQEEIVESNKRIYFSNRGNSSNIEISDVQRVYNLIRDNGGIWLDPKENNLVRLNNNQDVADTFTKNVDFYDTGLNFSEYDSNIYISDYEDVIFITPEMLRNMDKSTSWSKLPYGRPDNRIHTKYLDLDIEEIYEKNYIFPSITLLEFEEQYQIKKGNIEKAKKCKNRLKEIKKQIKKSENKIKRFNNRRDIKGRISLLTEKINNAIRNENKKKMQENNQIRSQIRNDRIKNDDNDPWRTL